jgi:CBS domain-containing protein
MNVAMVLAQKGREVATVSPQALLADAIQDLAARKIGALVVVEGSNRIVGIVSERDIVRVLAKNGTEALDQPIDTVMTRDVVTCAEHDTINSVMTRMTRGRFRHLPVVSSGRLAGIVSIGDVVKARIEEVEREADEMRSYIATA